MLLASILLYLEFNRPIDSNKSVIKQFDKNEY